MAGRADLARIGLAMSWMNSWKGPTIPWRTSVAMTVHTSDTRREPRASTVARTPMPAMKAVPFTRASPSLASSHERLKPGVSAARRRQASPRLGTGPGGYR